VFRIIEQDRIDDVKTIPEGMYLVKLLTSSGEVVVDRFMKME